MKVLPYSRNESSSWKRSRLLVLIAVVIIVFVAFSWRIGVPWLADQMRADEQRAERKLFQDQRATLDRVRTALAAYRQATGTLPKTLSELRNNETVLKPPLSTELDSVEYWGSDENASAARPPFLLMHKDGYGDSKIVVWFDDPTGPVDVVSNALVTQKLRNWRQARGTE